jgi:hypothetical protein
MPETGAWWRSRPKDREDPKTGTERSSHLGDSTRQVVPPYERRKRYGAGCSMRLPQAAGPATPGRLWRYEPVTGLVFHSTQYGGSTMTGRHRLRNRRVQAQRPSRHRAVEVVDARTLTEHFLTLDALAAGRLPKGRYIARCGQEVLPASLTEPGRNRCLHCIPIPIQRSRLS